MVKIKLGKTQESYSGHAFRDAIDADLIFHAVEQVIRYLVYTATIEICVRRWPHGTFCVGYGFVLHLTPILFCGDAMILEKS